MCCLLLGDSPVICKMLPSCRSPALCPPSPPVLPISMSQSGPTRPPPGLLDPPGFCKLGIFGQTLEIPGSQTCVFWQRGWVLSSACLAFHRYLAANWRLAAKECPGSPGWCVCECVSVRLALKATGAPSPGGNRLSAPDLSPGKPNKVFGSVKALHFTSLSVLFPPSILVKGFAKISPNFRKYIEPRRYRSVAACTSLLQTWHF